MKIPNISGVSTGPGWIDISDSSDYGYESICEYEL